MEVLINGVRFVPLSPQKAGQEQFGQLIKNARRAKQETLEQAACGIGTTKSHLWGMEKGKSEPGLEMLSKVLRYYGLRFEQIEPRARGFAAGDVTGPGRG